METVMKAPIALSLLLALALAGCAGEDFDYVAADEIPPGQGLFTGKSGALTVFAGGGNAEGDKSTDATRDNTSGKDEIPEGLPPDRPKR